MQLAPCRFSIEPRAHAQACRTSKLTSDVTSLLAMTSLSAVTSRQGVTSPSCALPRQFLLTVGRVYLDTCRPIIYIFGRKGPSCVGPTHIVSVLERGEVRSWADRRRIVLYTPGHTALTGPQHIYPILAFTVKGTAHLQTDRPIVSHLTRDVSPLHPS